VVVVEHDEEAIRAADYVVDMGPGAGRAGGQIVAEGTPAQIVASPDSLTGKYLAHALADRRAAPAQPSGERSSWWCARRAATTSSGPRSRCRSVCSSA
jgi:excinuclease ABC subunit A